MAPELSRQDRCQKGVAVCGLPLGILPSLTRRFLGGIGQQQIDVEPSFGTRFQPSHASTKAHNVDLCTIRDHIAAEAVQLRDSIRQQYLSLLAGGTDVSLGRLELIGG